MCLLRHAESLVAACRCYLWIYFNDVRGISTRHGSPDLNTQRGSVAAVTMRMQICQCGCVFVSLSVSHHPNLQCKLSAYKSMYFFHDRYVTYVCVSNRLFSPRHMTLALTLHYPKLRHFSCIQGAEAFQLSDSGKLQLPSRLLHIEYLFIVPPPRGRIRLNARTGSKSLFTASH